MYKTHNPTMPPPAVLAALRRSHHFYLIDEPSAFEGVKVWKHLRELRTLKQTP